MFFGLSKMLWAFVQPLTFLCLLALAGLALRLRWKALGQGVINTALCLIILLSLLPVGPALSAWWEYRYPPQAEIPKGLDGVVVLGGAFESYLSRETGQLSANGQIERLFCFVEIAKANPDAKLVFSGGSGDILNPDAREADDAAAFFRLVGLRGRDIIYEDRSRNTYENVIYTKDMLKPAASEKWAVVTSAVHMPRSMGIFEKAGWRVEPYPCDFNTDGSAGFFTRMPNAAANISALHTVFREMLGAAVYYVTGKSAFILPPRQVASPS